MFRGSAYSLETEKDFNNSQLLTQTIRMCLVGISDVGKSSIINSIENDRFREDIASTNGFQVLFKKLKISRYVINLHLWDGGGDHMLEFIKEKYFAKMDAILYVFDVTDLQSMQQLQQIHYEIKKTYHQDFVFVLVGNKSDLLTGLSSTTEFSSNWKQVNFLAQKFSKKHDILYLKVSAKENTFIVDSIVELIQQVLRKKRYVRTSRLLEEETLHENEAVKEPWCTGCQCKVM